MDQQLKMSSKVPIFNGEYYALWRIRMRIHILDIGLDAWMYVETRYKYPKSPPIDPEEKKQFRYNSKVVDAILDGLDRPIFAKVMRCKTSNEIWNKLWFIYEGKSKLKRSKLQTFKTQFESLKMKEEENISKYFERIDEIVKG